MGNGIIGRSLKICWENKKFYLTAGLIQFILILLDYMFFKNLDQKPSYSFSYISQFVNLGVLGDVSSPSFLVNALLWLADTYIGWLVARFVYLKLLDDSFDLKSNVLFLGKRFIKGVGASILYFLISASGFLILNISSKVFSLPILYVSGYWLFIIPSIILSLIFILGPYGVIFDDLTIIGGLVQSKNLTRGYREEMFFTFFLYGLICLPIIIALYTAVYFGQLTFELLLPCIVVYNLVRTNILVIWYTRLKDNYYKESTGEPDNEGYVEGEYRPFCPNCMKIYDNSMYRCPQCGINLERQ